MKTRLLRFAFIAFTMLVFLFVNVSFFATRSAAKETPQVSQPAASVLITQTTTAVSGWDTTRPWELFGFERTGVESIEYSPDYANDQTIFLTAYDGVRGYVYRSSDAGKTWTAIPDRTIAALDIAISPNYANDQTIFLTAGTARGISRSTDGGMGWTEVGPISETIRTLAISPNYANDHTIFAGADGEHVFRSTDGGETWTDLGQLLAGHGIRALAISPNYANDHTIFAGIGQAWSSYTGGVYRSTDGGNTWQAMNTGLTYREVWGLVISPDYPNDHTLFVAVWGGGVYRTTNSGTSWQGVNTGQPNRRPRTLAISPFYAQDKTVFYGTWGDSPPDYNDGIYVTTNGGDSWSAVNNNLPYHFIHQIAVSPTFDKDPIILAGAHLNPDLYLFGGLWRYDFDGEAKLNITKTAPNIVDVGSPITYTLTVTNTGTADAANLIITDQIPDNANYVSGGANNGGVVSWTVSALPMGEHISVQWVATATTTVVNADYNVVTDKGITATGQSAVVTLIKGCPPLNNYICVFDGYGNPISNSLVYRNSVLLTDADGQPLTTNEQGILIVPPLNSGETLAALQPVYEQPTDKHAHNPDGGSNFSFRIYRTTMPVSDTGEVSPYIVSSNNLPHILTAAPTQTLVLFNVVASVEWDADNGYLSDMESGLRQASNLLYDATDGQMAFGWITVYNNGEHWDDADIQVLAHNHIRPHAYVGGITATAPPGNLQYRNVSVEPGHIILGRYWNGYSGNVGAWNAYDGAATITHEFGHYGLFLFDEYFYYEGDGTYRVQKPSQCSVNDTDPASLMYFQYHSDHTKTEFCNRPEQYPEFYGGAPTRQTQVYGATETSWNTIIGVYSATLQSGGSTAPWAIVSPPQRGVNFVPGPTQVPLDVIRTTNTGQHISAFLKKLTVKFEGQPVWGAIVAQHGADGHIRNQGLTDRFGNINLLGVNIGDTIQVRTPDNSLGGSLVVQDASWQTLNLTAVYGRQTADTGTMPMVTIIPRADGSTIDYFVEQTGKLSGTVQASITGAQAPPNASAPMTYDDMMNRYFVTFSGYPTGTLSGLTFQMTATDTCSGSFELGIAHDRSWTDDPANDLNLITTDGNLILNAPGNSFDAPTYVVANPTNALPGAIPAGWLHIGEAYSIQPSGAITGSKKAMALTLSYQPLSLGLVDENTLRPYFWAAEPGGGGTWTPVLSYTLNATTNQVSASVNRFGIYILMGQTPPPMVENVTPITITRSIPTSVVIRGDNFQDGAQIRVGNVITLSGSSVTFVDFQTLLVTIPDTVPSGIYDITVINPDGQSGVLPSALIVSDGQSTYLPLVLKNE